MKNRPMKPAPTNARRPARDRVYAYLREQILRGAIKGGSFVEEEQISLAVGVSRTPVREAFHRLEAERFIDLLPRRGALVRQVTVQELVQVYEARRMIETYVIRRICEEGRTVPPSLDALLARMRTLAQTRDHNAQAEENRRFHRMLVALTGNDVILDLYDTLGARQQRVAISALAADPARLPMIHDQHEALLKALRARDAEGASAILAEHLRPVLEVVSRLPGYG